MQPESNLSTFEQRPVEAFLESLRSRDLSANTVAAYGAALCRLRASLGRDPVDVEHSALANWIAGLKASGLAASSRSLHISAMREFLGWAQSRGLRDDNPLKSKEFSIKRRDIVGSKTWDGMEIAAVSTLRRFAEARVREATDDRDRAVALRDLALVVLLSRGALRASECAGVQISDLSRAASGFHVLTVYGKGDVRRDVPFGQSDSAVLLRWRAARKFLAKIETGAFLVTESGEGFSGRKGIERRLDVLMAQAGLAKSHPHAIRHSRINEIANAGPIQVAQQFAGHANPGTTQIYTRRSAKDLIDGMKRNGVI